MRNITGSPAEDDDFFDRASDMARFLRELHNKGNLLVIAPRRVGKTSFTIRLCEECKKDDAWAATIFNVEGCSDEVDFAEVLIKGLRETGIQADWFPRLADLFHRIRRNLGGVKVGVGVDIEVSDPASPNNSTLSGLLESLLKRIEAEDRTVVVAIDELPELLLTIARQENGAEHGKYAFRSFLLREYWFRREVR